MCSSKNSILIALTSAPLACLNIFIDPSNKVLTILVSVVINEAIIPEIKPSFNFDITSLYFDFALINPSFIPSRISEKKPFNEFDVHKERRSFIENHTSISTKPITCLTAVFPPSDKAAFVVYIVNLELV